LKSNPNQIVVFQIKSFTDKSNQHTRFNHDLYIKSWFRFAHHRMTPYSDGTVTVSHLESLDAIDLHECDRRKDSQAHELMRSIERQLWSCWATT